MVVLAHLKTLEAADDPEVRRGWMVRLVKGLYSRGYGAEQVRQLYRLIDGMMTLPKPLAELAWQEIHDFERDKNMPYITTAERVGLEKGLAEGLAKGREEGLEEGLEKGLEKGREEGLEKGREEGLEKGREEGLLAGIEVALRIKFGQTALALMSEIRQIDDVELLRTVLDAVPQADSPAALRQAWLKS